MRRVALLPALVVMLAAAGSASAQTTATPPSTATPAPVTVPPASGTLSIRLERVNGTSSAVLAGDRFRVRGSVTPYVAGQQVVVRFYRRGRKIASRGVAVKPVSTGQRGTFVLGFSSRIAGRVVVRASHRATPLLATLKAAARTVDVLPLHASPGSTGLAVRTLQQRLAALGYVVGQRGVYDARTARAVLAFRKVTGMARTMLASEDVFRRLARGQGAFKVRYPKQGKHVEADLSRQVLVLARGSHVERIYPISSGKPSTPTILGTFRVYSKTPGTNAKGMVFTSYFHGGYGIHGYAEVPVYAASHGCLRVPIPDAVPIYDWISFGDVVDVYA